MRILGYGRLVGVTKYLGGWKSQLEMNDQDLIFLLELNFGLKFDYFFGLESCCFIDLNHLNLLIFWDAFLSFWGYYLYRCYYYFIWQSGDGFSIFSSSRDVFCTLVQHKTNHLRKHDTLNLGYSYFLFLFWQQSLFSGKMQVKSLSGQCCQAVQG